MGQAQPARVEVRLVLPVSLGVDHPMVDGAVAAQFLATLKQALENPRHPAVVS